jgi:hypothetical protein
MTVDGLGSMAAPNLLVAAVARRPQRELRPLARR